MLSVCLSIYLSMYLCIYVSMYLPIYLSIFLSIYLSSIDLFLSLSHAFIFAWSCVYLWPLNVECPSRADHNRIKQIYSLRKDKRWKSQRALLCAIQSSAVALWAYHFRAWHIRASLHPQFHFSWLQALTICSDSATRQWWTNKLKQHVRKKKLPHRLTFSW